MPKLPIFQLDLDFFGELGYKKILADHENFTTLFWLLALGQSNMNGASKPSKKSLLKFHFIDLHDDVRKSSTLLQKMS